VFRSKILIELSRVVHNDDGVHVHGPLTVDVDGRGFLNEVHALRRRGYERSAPHLLADFQNQIEKKMAIDEASAHFYARAGGQIVASLRLTRPPFEMSELSPNIREVVNSLTGYLEIGRLIVDDNLRGQGLGKKVLYQAMIWAYSCEYRGFIAICRRQRAQEFHRLGMRRWNREPFSIASRPDGEYYLMTGELPAILSRLAHYYGCKRILNVLSGKPATHWKKLVSPMPRRQHDPNPTFG